MRAVTLWKKGILVAGCGILAVFVPFIPGAGPCGPSSPIGAVVMTLGMLAVPLGALMVLIGLIKAGY